MVSRSGRKGKTGVHTIQVTDVLKGNSALTKITLLSSLRCLGMERSLFFISPNDYSMGPTGMLPIQGEEVLLEDSYFGGYYDTLTIHDVR